MPPVEMSLEDYHAAEGISKSGLDLIHRSPAHYRQEKACPSPATEAMIWGSLFHCYVLQPELFEESFAVMEQKPDRRTKVGQADWEAWIADNPGKEPIDRPAMVELRGMRDAVFANSRAAAALTGGAAEESIFWLHHSGLPCKARPDFINPAMRLIVDVKSSKDARPEAFKRAVWEYRYHVQAPFYTDGYEALEGELFDFVFIAVEKKPPYAVQCYQPHVDLMEQGRREYELDLAVYADCLARNEWPAYPDEYLCLELPAWAQDREEY